MNRSFVPALETLCVNSIRTIAIDAIQQANSGHPGLPLGAAPMAWVLWDRHLVHDPADPRWPDRDRFVLSAGHGCMLHYALLHLTGYDLGLDDLRAFRQWGSRTPGHPEFHVTPGVEATTGPLGQGTANAVGMAIAERMLAHRFNRPGHTIVDHRTWALVSDGDLMEGVSAEAASLAGHLRLGKLTCLYDSNDVSLDGPTSLAFSEEAGKRYEAYGWRVIRVGDGDHDLAAIDAALAGARSDVSRPTLIVVRTTIGFGSPSKAGKSAAHGAPLGVDEVARTKRALGWDPQAPPFHVPEEARARFLRARERGAAARADWSARFAAWAAAFPDLAREWGRTMAGDLPVGWDAGMTAYRAGESVATRDAGGMALNAIAARVSELAGGDADLSESTKTAIQGGGDFDGRTGAGRNLHFGVREHAMGAVANGLAYHGGVRPYVATFFAFSDYMRPPIRLAALNRLPSIFVFTHDSVGLGEDGPTHQPVEHLMALRAMPNLCVVRPADANETLEAWRFALQRREGPTALILTRQKVTVLDRSRLGAAAGLARGGYVLAEAEGEPEAIVIATGSEVKVALDARDRLQSSGVRTRVVSLPCWELFAAQDAEYRDAVLPPAVRARVSVEAGVTFGWTRWIGDRGIAVGIDRFGASAPGEVVLERLGITAERVVCAARTALDRLK